MENIPKEEDNRKNDKIEDIGTLRRIYSRLCLTKEDIEAIERMNIKDEAIKGLISGISNRTAILMEMLLGELNEK